jgi:hypothetical protein
MLSHGVYVVTSFKILNNMALYTLFNATKQNLHHEMVSHGMDPIPKT